MVFRETEIFQWYEFIVRLIHQDGHCPMGEETFFFSELKFILFTHCTKVPGKEQYIFKRIIFDNFFQLRFFFKSGGDYRCLHQCPPDSNCKNKLNIYYELINYQNWTRTAENQECNLFNDTANS
jgi:hypothetical protein